MTLEEMEAKIAACKAALIVLQARIDNLQQQIDNRDAFNNGLAFNVNRLLFDMKQLKEHGDNEAKNK